MKDVVHKKIKLFILAIIILIVLCLMFINHFNNKLYVKVIEEKNNDEIIFSDVLDIEEEIIADNTIKKEKNKINLSNIDINVKINDEYKEKYIVSINDKMDIEIINLDVNYQLYYSIRNNEINTEYKEFNKYFLKNIDTPCKFNLYVKVVVGKLSKEYNIGEFNVYDIVYEHNSIKEENIEIGTIYNDDGSKYVNEDNTEYLYDDKEINNNIVIDNVESEEEIKSEENDNEENINLNGNIYVIEETDLNDFDITGHLYIDTEENVTIDKDILDSANLYSITIKNNNFTINNEKYYYETIDNQIKINNSNNEEVNINTIINNSTSKINENNELTILKDESNSSFNLN